MKRILFLATTLLLCPVGERAVFAQIAVANSEEAVRNRDATASSLVRLIEFKLPRQNGLNLPAEEAEKLWSWSVWYQPQYNLVDVQCNQLVLMEPEFAFNLSINEKREPALKKPSFSFRVQPFISPEQYNRLAADNVIIDEQLMRMQGQMMKISRKFDSYSPRNAEEKKKVDQYNRLKTSRHDLPDFYFRDISVSWVWFPGRPSESRHAGKIPNFVTATENQEGWQREQADAAKAVLQLLSRYEPQEK